MSMRVLIADDQQLMLNAVISALRNDDDIDVVGATTRGADVVRLVDVHRPDLLLLDQGMAGTGIACIRHIKQCHPAMKIVTLSASETAAEIAEALDAGADAYVGKRINPADLPSALRLLLAGAVHHAGPERAPSIAPARAVAELTQREVTMLRAISRGLSTSAISRELRISEKTVKFHLTNMYRKLGVQGRAATVAYAFEHDLVSRREASGASAAIAS